MAAEGFRQFPRSAPFSRRKVSHVGLLVSRRAWALAMAFSLSLGMTVGAVEYRSGKEYPEPKPVDPGPVAGPPSDAIILFDGHDLSAWEGGDKWIVADGVATANARTIATKQLFGDCQLHLEFATPAEIKGEGQGRGNSGIHFMGRYEVQILDSYGNTTYFDGQCGAVYKQSPPLVNACRGPGEWQTYDILFETPLFDEKGKTQKPGYVTVIQNGIVVQNHTQIEGSTSFERPAGYSPHPPKLPFTLQYHNNPVRFRNIWVREL